MSGKCEPTSSDAIANKLGKLLWTENHRSINARYGSRARAPKYQYERVEMTFAEVLKQVHCYQYQSCEHKAWPKSWASIYMKDLKKHIYSANPGIADSSAYQEGPWGV